MAGQSQRPFPVEFAVGDRVLVSGEVITISLDESGAGYEILVRLKDSQGRPLYGVFLESAILLPLTEPVRPGAGSVNTQQG